MDNLEGAIEAHLEKGDALLFCEYPQELLERLSPERRRILQPVPPLRPPQEG